jgi:hypothetical protein
VFGTLGRSCGTACKRNSRDGGTRIACASRLGNRKEELSGVRHLESLEKGCKTDVDLFGCHVFLLGECQVRLGAEVIIHTVSLTTLSEWRTERRVDCQNIRKIIALTLRAYQRRSKMNFSDLPEELEDRAMLLDAIRNGEVKLNQAVPAYYWFTRQPLQETEGQTLQLSPKWRR